MIDEARESLNKSDLPRELKANALMLLTSAEDAQSGNENDRIQALTEWAGLLTCHELRQLETVPDLIAKSVKAHAIACPMTKPGALPIAIAKSNRPPWMDFVSECLKSWPLAAALIALAFAPNAPAIIDKVTAIFK